MTIEERISKANNVVQNYWDMMKTAKEFGNKDDAEYWMVKWAGACEVYDLITGSKWEAHV